MMIIIDILEPPAFQKYSTCYVFLTICVFVFVYFTFDTWECHIWYPEHNATEHKKTAYAESLKHFVFVFVCVFVFDFVCDIARW